MPPTASIIIPNYENGRESSVDGGTDLLGDLFESLHHTLRSDPTDVEILVADDGSGDDSLETARAWSRRTWRDGRPFCRLFEHEHTGRLSVVLNRLMERATGRLICRMDGDVLLRSPGWLARVVERFDSEERLGVLGGRQLDCTGALHSVGDLLLHPHGYQHVGAGAASEVSCPPYEHDHVMGCFHLLRRTAFDEVGDYDESMPRGQTVDLGVRLLQSGWKAMTDPDIVYEHRLALRRGRSSSSDGQDSLAVSRRIFLEKWGFDRLVPDQDAMRDRLGEVLVPTTEGRFPDPAGIGAPEDEIENRVALVRGAVRPNQPVRVAMIGAGDGSVPARLVGHGIKVTGLDDRPEAIEAARAVVDGDALPVPHLVDDLARLPIEEGLIDILLVDRVLERHRNPIALLKEARRIMAPGGLLLLLARWRTPEEQLVAPRSASTFTPTSLRMFLAGSGCFRSVPFATKPFPHPQRDVLLYALHPLAEIDLGREAFDGIGDPTLVD